jgi:hypothetical protein
MGKAAFFRNAKNLEILQSRTSTFKGIVSEYQIIAEISLNKQEFDSFCMNFQYSWAFLFPFINKSFVRHNVWNCISVTCGTACILVLMNGYQYPRYLAILSD